MVNVYIKSATVFLVGLIISGCAGMPAKYTPQYSMTQKLPGTFELQIVSPETEKAKQKYDSGTISNLAMIEAYQKEMIVKDFKDNVFDGQGNLAWTVEILFADSRKEDSCYVNDLTLSLFSGPKISGKYPGKQKACIGLPPVFGGLEYVKIHGTNATLVALEDIKRQINADRENIIAKMNEGSGYSSALSRKNPSGKMNIAVSDLSAEGVSQSNASIVADWLRGALVSAGTYTVVERSAMQKILSEQAFQQTGCTSQECAVKLGKLLNVQRMVVGSFGKFLDSYVLNVRVVDIESGEVVYSDSANGATTKEVEANIKALSQRLSK